MADPAPTVLTLEIDDHDAEHITGTLTPAAGPPLPFTGWLGLAAAIERATATGSTEKMRDDPS